MRQNRRFARKECIAKVQITWQAAGHGNKGSGMIEDKSEGGLGINFPTPIDVGSVVAITQGFSTSFAVVRHCSKQKNKFFLGVEFCAVAEGTQTPSVYKTPIDARQSEDKRRIEPIPLPFEPKEKESQPTRLGDFAMLEPLQRQQ